MTEQIILPNTWADLTLAQYLALATPGAISLASVLPNLAPELLAQLSTEEQEVLASRILLTLDGQVLADLLPTPGLLEIGLSAYGLYKQAEEYLSTIPHAHPLAHGAYLYALYREPKGSKAPEEHLAAAHAAVLAAPVTEVYADCCYFLASYHRVGTGQPATGVAQAGVLRLVKPAIVPQGLWARLGNLWSPAKQAQA